MSCLRTRSRRIDPFVECCRRGEQFFFDGIEVVERFRQAKPLPVDVLNLVASDGDEPCAERRLALKCREPLQGGEKHILNHIVDEIRPRRQAMADIGVHGIDVRSDKPRRRLPVSPENRRNQFPFIGSGSKLFDRRLRLAGGSR
jgi:hypothetical protein